MYFVCVLALKTGIEIRLVFSLIFFFFLTKTEFGARQG